jgi:hypothetical protein
MKDLKLNKTSWDLEYTNGDLVIIEDQDVVEQSIKIALLTNLGEWTYDTEAGTGWITQIMGKNSTEGVVEAEIRRVVLGVDGVTEVTDVEIDLDAVTRSLTVTARVATIFGDTEASLTV